jgi:hypothetical protein
MKKRNPFTLSRLAYTGLCALLMPFYAYSLGGPEVYILPLYEDDTCVVHKLDLKYDDEHVIKLLFSQEANLYVITKSHKAMYAYRFAVGEDLAFQAGQQSNKLKDILRRSFTNAFQKSVAEDSHREYSPIEFGPFDFEL